MTTSLAYSGATLPTSGELPDFPAAMLAFGNGIDQGLNLVATSQSDRDTRYANVRAGTKVTCALSSTSFIEWIKTTTPPAAAAWVVSAERTTPVTSGVVTASTGWTVTSQWAQRINGVNTIAIVLAYSGSTVTGADATTSSAGNVSDTTMATLQTAWQVKSGIPGASRFPFQFIYGRGAGTGNVHGSTNTIDYSALATSGQLQSGDTLEFAVSYPGA